MVQAQINISEHANRVINMIKAKYGVRNKSEAIDIMAKRYEKELLEPSLKPEFIEEMKKLKSKGKYVKIRDIDKLLGLK